jgi:hypothetical protein
VKGTGNEVEEAAAVEDEVEDQVEVADEADSLCELVADSVAGGHGLEDVLRTLLACALPGHESVVIAAEARCRALAASDPRWARTHLVLRHALGTGLFGPVQALRTPHAIVGLSSASRSNGQPLEPVAR